MIFGPSTTITVAAGQLQARLMNEAAATREAIAGLVAEAARKGAELLVLPECAYPAYLLGSVASYRAGDHLSSEAFVGWLAGRAAAHRLHVVCGFVEDTGRELFNAAVLIDASGREIGRARKRFLWHADHDWFAPGDEVRTFDCRLGRIGIVICAEMRMPEIVATLVADGVTLIAMPTCWINNARQPGEYANPQVEFLVEARAREFGVPLVCADKSGLEMTTGYVGQSCIVRADGSLAAKSPPTGESVAIARIPLRPRPPRLWVSESIRGRLLSDRPPTRPTRCGPSPIKVAAVPAEVLEQRFRGGMGEALLAPLRDQGVRLLIANVTHEAVAERLSMVARAFDIHAVGFPMRADLHDLGPARIGCVAGQWVRSFAAARALALDGAQLLAMFDAPAEMAILRSRALENRVYVVGVASRSAAVIGPDGAVLARGDEDHPDAAVAEIDLAEASDKCVAPRTDIFDERRASLYRF